MAKMATRRHKARVKKLREEESVEEAPMKNYKKKPYARSYERLDQGLLYQINRIGRDVFA